ncbi:MAG TPA: glycine cleavage T C-terminal barrel domain-containing protein [Acidimicrobiales bacterium]|nr:glycine cleavage T C-terminal barrel domain-containing protein [Acidimicrobiales bacterium]
MTERADRTYEAIRESAAWRLVPRDGVVVSGPGALDWLQGQVSQDLSGLVAGGGSGGHSSTETLVLSPQGKIDSFCRVTALGPDAYLLDVGSGFGEMLCERLRRFKLRVKADLELLDKLGSLEVRGPRAPSAAELAAQAGAGAVAVVPVDWPAWRGSDVLFRRELPLDPAQLDLGATAGEDESFEAARIEAGVPVLGRELTERTIPQEAGELVAHTVSFTKGCYTGQELVARIDARGSNTPRSLRGVVIEGGEPVAGDEVVVDGATVGALTSVAWSPGFGSHVALAYIKRGTSVPAAASVSTSGFAGTEEVAGAKIERLPLVSG